jgi:hypothetical protein
MSESADLRLRLTTEQRREIERLAARERISAEEFILRAVRQVLSSVSSSFPMGSPFHGFDAALEELGDGPADLSTNRAYRDDLGR